jgi:hypothetical protein
MASFASREGTAASADENVAESSLPRADQRPCSTQNDASATRPERGGRIRLATNARSCLPPFTMSPD